MTTIAVLGLTLIALALLAALYVQADRIAKEREGWTEERRELLTRIQHPELVPVAPRPDLMIPDRENDDWNKVGTIEWDPAYGLEDDVNG